MGGSSLFEDQSGTQADAGLSVPVARLGRPPGVSQRNSGVIFSHDGISTRFDTLIASGPVTLSTGETLRATCFQIQRQRRRCDLSGDVL